MGVIGWEVYARPASAHVYRRSGAVGGRIDHGGRHISLGA